MSNALLPKNLHIGCAPGGAEAASGPREEEEAGPLVGLGRVVVDRKRSRRDRPSSDSGRDRCGNTRRRSIAPAGGTAPPGIVLAIARPASRSPAPQTLPLRQIESGGNSRAVPCRIESTRPAVSVGSRASIIDTTPLTCGAEALVPISVAYASLPGTVWPSFDSERHRGVEVAARRGDVDPAPEVAVERDVAGARWSRPR